jgi:general secretion pathway protein B
MSYILEALKKSQQERELGQVPTLVAGPATEVHRAARGKPWGLVAVGLAALAVAIALYGVLHRVQVQPVAPSLEAAEAAEDPAAPAPAAVEAVDPEPRPGSEPQVAAVPLLPVQTPATEAGGGLQTIGAVAPPAGAPPGLADNAIRGDVPASPRNGRAPRTMGRDALAAPEEDIDTIESGDGALDPMEEPASNDWMEMDEEIGPAEPAEPPPPARQPRPQRPRPGRATTLPEPQAPPVPDDLRQDVEAFKEQVRRERSGAPPKPAAPADPTKLRLPLEIESRLPAFFMTAHIYDLDASRRFVVINALKYSQGDTTREGLKVEEILPDGVVLGFQGHRFYKRR